MSLVVLLAVAQAAALPMLALPPGGAAWVVRIETAGGDTGRGTGSSTTDATGEVLCAGVSPCSRPLDPHVRQSIASLVLAIPATPETTSAALPSTGICNDCVTTTMTVWRRDRRLERKQIYRWDETTRASVPPDALRLDAAIVALAAARTR